MIYQGDCLDILPTLSAKSVQCCVTSPPYYGLRDYGCAGQIGLESTPEAYVEKLVAVFREVHRVLTDDGTLWLNLGDSYCATTKGSGGHSEKQDSNKGSRFNNRKWHIPTGLKPKDLVGIPWRVAFALQADGWYLRQDIIWAKPNPMPESVTDRCTKSHEYIFLLTKSARYYYDADAIKEPCVYAEQFEERCERAKDNHKAMPTAMKNGIRPRKKTPQTFGGAKARNNEILEGDPRFRNGSEQWGRVYETTGTRNKRSVWPVTTQPYKEAHFATFPEEIPRTCILAGSKKGDTILDPFSGAGTTGVVAEKLNRKYIGIELNPQYTKLSEDRIYNVQPLFAGLEL
jgi:DNA modification methylase